VNHRGRVTFSVAGPSDGGTAPPDFGTAEEVWRDNDGVVCARGISSGAHAWMEIPGVGAFCFDRERRAVVAYAGSSVAIDLIYDNFYRAALPMALQYFGCEVLHASAVNTAQGVVGFCAISGTGKSTTVAALSRSGYPAWADDAVVVEIGDSGIAQALEVPFRLRVEGSPWSVGAGEASMRWPEPGPLELAPAPLAALCVLRRLDPSGRSEISRLPAVDAVGALLPHAYCFSLADPERKRLMMQRYIDLAARVSVYAVSLASGLDKLPAALDLIERTIPGFIAPALR
jgi:hypothetical protein